MFWLFPLVRTTHRPVRHRRSGRPQAERCTLKFINKEKSRRIFLNFPLLIYFRYEVRPKVRLEMSMLLKPFIYEYSSLWDSVQVPSSALDSKAGSLIIQGFLFFVCSQFWVTVGLQNQFIPIIS